MGRGLRRHPFFTAGQAGADAVHANGETVFMEIAKQLFNPECLLAAILVAVMSTLSCQRWCAPAR